MKVNKYKVRIFQPIVPEYRVGLFNRVGRLLGENVQVWAASQTSQSDQSYPLADMAYDYSHQLQSIGPIKWQKGLSLKGLKPYRDVIVICGDVHQLSSLWIAFRAKLKGIGVVWWGHHKSVGATERNIRIRLWFVRHLATVILSYTKAGKEWYQERGFKEDILFFTGNTLDENPIIEACDYWKPEKLAQFRKEKQLIGKSVLLFCSVLRKKTHLEQAIDCLVKIKDENVILSVIGDGPDRQHFQEYARHKGVNGRIIWVGELRDQQRLAPWFLSAKFFLYPGAIGLSIIHSFFYGLPVVTHSEKSHHGPEFVAMKHGETGMVYSENDVDSMSRIVEDMLSDPLRLKEMSDNVRRIAFSQYSMNHMAKNYCESIEKCFQLISVDK